MTYSKEQHTFVVCAYKESPYLEECIDSLVKQSKPSNIVISTSTPNEYIAEIAKKHNIKILINPEQKGISYDWNYGFSQINTPLVTIAHQDDIYERNYLDEVIRKLNNSKKPLIVFTNYGELRNSKKVFNNKLLRAKRILLFPLTIKYFRHIRIIRRMSISLGNSICCPSVTYIKKNLPSMIFEDKYKSNLDWQAWEKISKCEGEFVYCNKILMFHRIHEESTTSKMIAGNKRIYEDYEMFCKFWPKCIAKMLVNFYKKGEKYNNLS